MWGKKSVLYRLLNFGREFRERIHRGGSWRGLAHKNPPQKYTFIKTLFHGNLFKATTQSTKTPNQQGWPKVLNKLHGLIPPQQQKHTNYLSGAAQTHSGKYTYSAKIIQRVPHTIQQKLSYITSAPCSRNALVTPLSINTGMGGREFLRPPLQCFQQQQQTMLEQ